VENHPGPARSPPAIRPPPGRKKTFCLLAATRAAGAASGKPQTTFRRQRRLRAYKTAVKATIKNTITPIVQDRNRF
jgi:hypothetical protein